MDGHRCFVMPLNRDAVLPPRSLFDLIHKMWDGYYEVNTDVVRETMRVILPPLTDLEEFGTYISKECKDLPTYQLEKYVGGGKKCAFLFYHHILITIFLFQCSSAPLICTKMLNLHNMQD